MTNLRLTTDTPDAQPVHSDVNDRRSHKRFGVQRPGKIYRRSSQQYVPVSSRDLSFGGALVEVESDRPFTIGEVLDVGISLTQKPVIPVAAMIGGVVVRSFALGEHRQLIAVRYLHRDAVSAAA